MVGLSNFGVRYHASVLAVLILYSMSVVRCESDSQDSGTGERLGAAVWVYGLIIGGPIVVCCFTCFLWRKCLWAMASDKDDRHPNGNAMRQRHVAPDGTIWDSFISSRPAARTRGLNPRQRERAARGQAIRPLNAESASQFDNISEEMWPGIGATMLTSRIEQAALEIVSSHGSNTRFVDDHVTNERLGSRTGRGNGGLRRPAALASLQATPITGTKPERSQWAGRREASQGAQECSVCFDAIADTQCDPCGHSLCHRCAARVVKASKPCPFCRTPVLETVRVSMS